MKNNLFNIIRLDEINSTNEYALNLISSNKQVEWTIVLANFQTMGKGQGTNIWQSEKNANILMSIILKPEFIIPSEQYILNMSICNAIANTLQEMGNIEIKIKWPNDIILNDKKIGGILIQNIISSSQIKYSVVGIGLNINQEVFSDEMVYVSSLTKETGKKYSLKQITNLILEKFYSNYNKLKIHQSKDIIQEFNLNLWKRNQKVVALNKSNENVELIIFGVSEKGELIASIGKKIKKIIHGEIKLQY
jgi:BirA family transcriptional regulator, biotin operon repressor / biotin---[acetyl-CoA-carboxylase] ligase